MSEIVETTIVADTFQEDLQSLHEITKAKQKLNKSLTKN